MKDEIDGKVIDITVRIELSCKDAHWKANKKAIVHSLHYCCKEGLCQGCKEGKCSLAEKIAEILKNCT